MEFRLYIAGSAPNSIQALNNLHEIGEKYLAGRYQVEVVDVLEEPLRALHDGVIITPMLIRLRPTIIRIAGNLSDREKVFRALGLDSLTTKPQA